MAAINKRMANIQARKTVNRWGMGFAGVAWIPLSHFIMIAGDLAMVVQIGSIYGVDIDKTKAATVFASVAAPIIGKFIAHFVLDFIPILGWAAKSGVAFGVTKLIGAALIKYFEDCSMLPE